MARHKNHGLIVGAGPCGLAAALFLRERAIDVEIIDGAWLPPVNIFSVVLHPDSLARLHNVGVEFDLVHDAAEIQTIAVYHLGRRGAELDLRTSRFGYAAVVPCWLLCEKLVHQLHNRHLAVQWQHRLGHIEASRHRVTVDIDVIDSESMGYAIEHEEHIVRRVLHRQPTFLIGADGADSVVRGQLGVPWQTVAPPELIAIFEIDGGPQLGSEIRVMLGDATSVLWPLARGGTRIAFQLPPSDHRLEARAASGDAPDADDLAMLVASYLPDLGAPMGAVRNSCIEQIPVGIAARSSLPAVRLLGASASALPQRASMTLNLGIRAANDLAAALSRVLHEHASPQLLNRQAASQELAILGEARVGDSYAPSERATPLVRDQYRRILLSMPASGDDRDRLARQLELFPMAPPLSGADSKPRATV